MTKRPIRKVLGLLAAGTLLLGACAVAEDDGTPEPSASQEADDTGEEGSDDAGEPAAEIKIGQGVTAEPCPDSPNPDNGCIYLGVLSDLTEGPFAALARPITDAQVDFWDQINAAGGLDGYDVDINTYTRDTKYQAAEHAAAYNQMSDKIAAIAQTLGTVNTEAVLDDMKARSLVAVPTTWWSGFAFNDNDGGIVMETGYSYCTEAIVGLDWFAENMAKPGKVQAVGYPGDYGGDSAEGVKRWAELNDAQEMEYVPTAPNQVAGNQDAVVAKVLSSEPDVVVLGIGPAETAEIVGKLAASGFTGQFLGALPTWNPALLDSPAAPALQALYHHMSPYQNYDGDSKAIADMKAALGGELPANGGYLIGWAVNYPMKVLLQAAIANGDLTPEGIASQIDGLTVDFDGMVPAMTYGGDVQANATQSVNIGKPNPEIDLGIETIAHDFVGPTFDKTDYTAACSASS